LPTIRPPATGPKIGTTTTIVAAMAAARPRRRLPAAVASIVLRSGNISPAAAPCTSRNPIRAPMFQAAPARTEPARKTASEYSHTRFCP
jgi:hypothetical protein